MDENLLEIRTWRGMGYKPLVDFGNWRVAVLRFLEELRPDKIESMERHAETDEVFVLVEGRGVLIIGGDAPRVDRALPKVMQIAEVCNVRRGVWHTILLSQDASVLIVENSDTGDSNTEFDKLSPELRAVIVETARRERMD